MTAVTSVEETQGEKSILYNAMFDILMYTNMQSLSDECLQVAKAIYQNLRTETFSKHNNKAYFRCLIAQIWHAQATPFLNGVLKHFWVCT